MCPFLAFWSRAFCHEEKILDVVFQGKIRHRAQTRSLQQQQQLRNFRPFHWQEPNFPLKLCTIRTKAPFGVGELNKAHALPDKTSRRFARQHDWKAKSLHVHSSWNVIWLTKKPTRLQYLQAVFVSQLIWFQRADGVVNSLRSLDEFVCPLKDFFCG